MARLRIPREKEIDKRERAAYLDVGAVGRDEILVDEAAVGAYLADGGVPAAAVVDLKCHLRTETSARGKK